MSRQILEQSIAADLNTCDLIEVLGTKSAKVKARKHRKACYAEIRKWNQEDDCNMSDDELLLALTE